MGSRDEQEHGGAAYPGHDATSSSDLYSEESPGERDEGYSGGEHYTSDEQVCKVLASTKLAGGRVLDHACVDVERSGRCWEPAHFCCAFGGAVLHESGHILWQPQPGSQGHLGPSQA